MKNKLIYILFISFLFMQDEIGIGLYDDDLINYLKNNYKTNSVLSYDSARDVLYGEIEAPQNNGQVYGVYTNYSVTLPSGVDPSSHLYNNGIDCEHLWPQSMYEGSSPMKSDMHHLRPCKSNVNSSRGNKPYNEIQDNLTNTWYWLNTQSNNIPTSNIDEYSESGSNKFEPREDIKGDIARSMFYFYTMYTNEADDNFFNLQKEILYQWHNNDPVTNNEINRTWAIASYQNNIPNPFILDSTLVYRCYFYDESVVGCDGVPNSGLELDECGVCDGNNLSCIDICGIPNGNNLTCADMNNDNTINVSDVIFLVNLVLSGTANNVGDLNNDNLVNITDIVMLINIILGGSL